MAKSIPDQVIQAFMDKVKSENILNDKGQNALRRVLESERFKKNDLEEAINQGLSE